MNYKKGFWWLAAYGVVMLITFLSALLYWESKNADFWMCRAIEGSTCDVLKPDGPMGALLFGLISLGVTLLFGLTFWAFNRKRNKKEKHEDL